MMEADEELEKSYKLIRQRFIGKLRDWLPFFVDLKVQLQQGTVTEIENIHMQVHKLAGSARTFGFPRLNTDAVAVEQYLRQLIDGTGLSEVLASLQSALDTFLTEIKKIVNQPGANAQTDDSSPNSEEMSKNCDYQVLIADDDELVRALLKRGLSKANCKVTQVKNGKQVVDYLEYLKQHPLLARPDLIVLDLNMPEMNGFDALKVINSDTHWQKVPVIMLTGRDEDETVIESISSGVLDYITKPFKLPEVVKRIISTIQRHKTTVLIADDDELICELLQQRFYRMGYSVIIAKNGNEALTRMHTDQPSVAVLDVMMPGMDGLAVLQQAKQNPLTADIPVVVLTAKNQQENILKGLETGAHDYITKPFDVDELAARLSGILRRQKTV